MIRFFCFLLCCRDGYCEFYIAPEYQHVDPSTTVFQFNGELALCEVIFPPEYSIWPHPDHSLAQSSPSDPVMS